MRTATACLALLAAMMAPAAMADCMHPAVINVPENGATATEQELIVIQEQVRAYIAAMDEYIACENETLTTSGSDAADQFLFLMNERIEGAREEADRIASSFNAQVEAFRAARQQQAGSGAVRQAPVQ